MEKKNTSLFVNALIWGVIIGLVSVVYSVILYMLDQALNNVLGYLGFIIIIAGLAIAMKSYRDNVLDGILPFGKAFGFGILIVLISAVISGIYGILLYTIIDPDLIGKAMDASAGRMLEQGLSEDQVEQALEISKRFMKPVFMFISGLVVNLLVGVVLSLIMAAIFKKEE
jgi:zinc transporter ZupT